MTLGFFGADYTWKRRFDRILNEGLRRVSFSFIFFELMCPVLRVLLDYLLIPYFLSVSVLKVAPFLEYDMDYIVQNLLVRYSYAVFFLVRAVYFSCGVLISYMQERLDAIRDAKYLLARELTNRPEVL